MEQLELFGAPLPRGGRDVVFFGMLLGSQLGARARALVEEQRLLHGLTGPMHPAARQHLSLLFAGFRDRLSDAEIAALQAAAEAAALCAFRVAFTGLMSFGRPGQRGNRPLVLVPGEDKALLLALAERIEHEARRRCVPIAGRAGGEPHLTLLYDRRVVPPTRLDPPITVTIDGVQLIHSHRGKGRYTIL